MKTIEDKLEELQNKFEQIELKIHRKILEKENEEKLTSTHTN